MMFLRTGIFLMFGLNDISLTSLDE